MATYGGKGSDNTFEIAGKKVYAVVDAETGETTYYEDRVNPLGVLNDIKLGTKKPGEDFVPHEGTALGGLFPDGFSDVFEGDAAKKFLSDEGQKQLDQEAKNTAIRAQKKLGVDDATARLRTQQLMDPDRTEALTDPNQEGDESAAELAQQGLDDLNSSFDDLANSDVAQANANTKKGPGSFGDHSYPVDRNQSQDFMKFTLLEYKPKKIGSGADGSGFGFGGRPRVGPNGQSSDRTILGSVSLPIPGGIKDENGADWAGKTMNEVEIQAAGIARGMLGVSGEGGVDAAQAVVGRLGTNNEAVKKAIGEAFAGKAVGVQGLMTRTTGMIFNPNLELLFDKPTLRGFQFTFDLVPRSKNEAEEIVKIIRFFKQGMSPIRSESNLFLLSPNVFQVHYVLNGDGTNDHPYIGKMKECAMTNFAVDYTPQQNYSTLKDGFMTAYKISMQLKELEPVFNDDYGTGSPVEIGF